MVPVSVAENVGVVPAIKLLLASFKVIVTVEVATPSATTDPVPVMVEFTIDAPAAVKVTLPSDFTTGVAIANVFTSAFKEERVQVDTPEAFVEEQLP